MPSLSLQRSASLPLTNDNKTGNPSTTNRILSKLSVFGNAGRVEVSNDKIIPSPPILPSGSSGGGILRGQAPEESASKGVTWSFNNSTIDDDSQLHSLDPVLPSSPSSSKAEQTNRLDEINVTPLSPAISPPLQLQKELLLSPVIAPSTLAGSALGTINEHEAHDFKGLEEMNPGIEEPPLLVLDDTDDETTIQGVIATSIPGLTRSPAGSISEVSIDPAVDIDKRAERPGRRISPSSSFSSKFGKLKARISGHTTPPSTGRQNEYEALRRALSRPDDDPQPSAGLGFSVFGRGRTKSLGLGRSASLPINQAVSLTDPMLLNTIPPSAAPIPNTCDVANDGTSDLLDGQAETDSRGRGSNGKEDSGKLKPKVGSGRLRSRSPFFSRGRKRIVDLDAIKSRDNSPVNGAISGDDDTESDGESVVSNSRYRPSSTNFEKTRSGSDVDLASDEEDEENELVDQFGDIEDVWDPETSANTEANAVYFEGAVEDEDGLEMDNTGEGPNVVRSAEPEFSSASQMRRPAASETKEMSNQPSRLELVIGRPEYGKNNCTIRMTNGDPDEALEASNHRLRSYVVFSDLSDESAIALEWSIATVLRSGDELFVCSVMEAADKTDSATKDRAAKLKNQKERQTTALVLVKQTTALLNRTQLHVTVTAQALHAKNAKHLMIDLIDHINPTLVVMGSRGLGKLAGIVLGSTSRYLIEKSSCPVMVARRRLHVPRKTDPSKLRHSPRVALKNAGVEKVASRKQEDDGLDAAQIEAEEDAKVAGGK